MRRAGRTVLILVAALVLGVTVFLAFESLNYRAAVLRAAETAPPLCQDSQVQTLLVAGFARRTPGAYRYPHSYLAVRLFPEERGTAAAALRRAVRAKLGPLLVTPAQAAGAYCAVAPLRDRLRDMAPR